MSISTRQQIGWIRCYVYLDAKRPVTREVLMRLATPGFGGEGRLCYASSSASSLLLD